MANGEVPNAATGQAYTEAELNAQIANWLGRLANMRNRLKYMRDTIMTGDAEFDSLALNIFGVPKETADALGQAVSVAGDALSAAVGSPVSLWEIDINN